MGAGVAVRVPGSTSNLGSGFDCVGMAVGRLLRVSARCVETPGGPPITFERRGTLGDHAVPPEDDLIYVGFRAACRSAGHEPPARLAFTADSQIPVSRGLGSSAAAVVAGAAAANALLGLGLDAESILELCAGLEGHPDNVAPAVYGGARLVLRRPGGDGLVTMPLDVHPALTFVFAVPDLRVETKRARAVLPDTVPHATAVQAAARAAALVHALATADPTLLGAALDDLLHVPFRHGLVRGFDSVVGAARAAGAYGATLSGSGPTLVALTAPERAERVGSAMVKAWRDLRIAADSFAVAGHVAGYETAPTPSL